ncbi:OprO/OprP family phosphate-selective porin [Algiphilus sp.]|uniref:OprO/OprP family phosphate-selective porin n=1 Tax=Algiphilus sp. TaxID=1872431 RepID=UPI003BA9C5B8
MKFFIRGGALGIALLALSGTAQAVSINTDGRLVISAEDGTFSARISGRLHADANLYDSDRVEHDSGAFVRRARIGVMGHIRNWDYEVTFDNATDESDLKDAFVARQLGPGRLIVGQFKQFQGFEEITSSNDIVFIERSHVSNSMIARALGVGYHGTRGFMGYAVSGYNLREASDGGARAVDDGVGGVLRLYAAPIQRDRTALHLGFSFSREVSDLGGTRGRLRPLGRSDEGRFTLFDASSGRDDVAEDARATVDRLNMELAALHGPVAFEAEWLVGSAEPDDAPDQDFSAYHAQLSYALTGGSPRRYDLGEGRTKNLRPSTGSIGAFEVALRYQFAENEAVPGAELTTVDTALNYYPNRNVRFMLNYSMAENALSGDEPNLLSFRAQVAF